MLGSADGEVSLARSHDAVLVPVLAWRELAWQRMRDALEAVWGEPVCDPMVEPHVERGPAGWVLVNVANQPGDVLVVGAGRRGMLQRAR